MLKVSCDACNCPKMEYFKMYPAMLPWQQVSDPAAMITGYILNIISNIRCHDNGIYQIHAPMDFFDLKC